MFGYWVARETENTDKLTLFFLDPNQGGKACSSKNKNQLKIHFQQPFGNQLSPDSTTMLIAGNFSKIDDFSSLESMIFLSYAILAIVLSPDTIHTLKFHTPECQEMSKHKWLSRPDLMRIFYSDTELRAH